MRRGVIPFSVQGRQKRGAMVYFMSKTPENLPGGLPFHKPDRAVIALSFERRRVPVVLLALAAAAPGVERVVHSEPVLEHFVVVSEVGRQPEGQCEEAGRLRCQL